MSIAYRTSRKPMERRAVHPGVVAVAAFLLLVLPVDLAGAQLAPECIRPDTGTGTVGLPPAGCDYLSPDEAHLVIDGLPPGTTLVIAPIHGSFLCGDPAPGGAAVDRGEGCEIPAPGPGGPSVETFTSVLTLNITGTSLLSSVDCQLVMPNVGVVVETGPRDLGAPVQIIDAEMKSLSGTLTTDTTCNLFDNLTITAGVDQGLTPTLGTTTLQLAGDGSGNFNVDSFFDVHYRIAFVGKAGGALDGRSGTTLETVSMRTSSSVMVPTLSTWGVLLLGLLLMAALAVVVLRRRAAGGTTTA